MTLKENPYNRVDIAPGRWVVLCRKDRQEDDTPGKYILATSSGFLTEADAQHYADSCSPAREPLLAKIPG